MSKKETSLYQLQYFLPPNTFPMVAPYFRRYTIHLTLTRERKTVLGDYREPTKKDPHHRISVNINLNKYNFLITLIHELAHMVTHDQFGRKAAPHGNEWKTQFRHMLMPFIGKKIFPNDVEKALMKYMQNPAASTCTDQDLYRALYNYDQREHGHILVCDLLEGQWFRTEDGRVFEKLKQLRTRSLCKEVGKRGKYLFPGIYEVKRIRRAMKRTA